MALSLGIDTGGTYTDAVFYDDERGVTARAKALTTKDDLLRGISAAVNALPESGLASVSLVSLSTTLATNSVVEGYRVPVCLIMIGCPDDLLEREGLATALAGDPVITLAGGHDSGGNEQEELDEAALVAALKDNGRAEAFAVCSYFAVHNPSHELRVMELIREITGKPVTAGHELTSKLNAARRAVTTIFNARLIPVISELIAAVRKLMKAKGLNAPLMIVKGDGSLMSAAMAERRPVETILSGPAASVVGALRLSGERLALVSDMGGTTTDIALVENGMPRIAVNGAEVGGFRTMVEAASIHTVGLGGDGEVLLDKQKRLSIAPRRVVPLSILCSLHPSVREILETQARAPLERISNTDGRFAVSMRRAEGSTLASFTAGRKVLMERISVGPVPVSALLKEAESEFMIKKDMEALANMGYLQYSAFTPTDAAVLLDLDKSWPKESARAGARIMLRLRDRKEAEEPDILAFSAEVRTRVIRDSALALARAFVAETLGISGERWKGVETVLEHEWSQGGVTATAAPASASALRLFPRLDIPIVAIGAPVGSYYPPLAELLGTRVVVPPYADVANAVGAVAGSVRRKAEFTIVPTEDGLGFKMLSTDGNEDFEDFDVALEAAKTAATAAASTKARADGAASPSVELTVDVRNVPTAHGGELFVDALVVAVATGRPAPAILSPDT